MLPTRQQHMHYDPKRPDINTLRVLMIQCYLRSHVYQGSHMLIIRAILVAKAEVYQFDGGLF